MITFQLESRQFDKALADYMVFQKRTPADVVNAKLMWVAIQAIGLTKKADKGEIERTLLGKSNISTAPLAAVIINSQLGKRGEKGLTGAKMSQAITKLIAERKRAVNYVRAGWKNAIVILEKYLGTKGELNFARRGAPHKDKEAMKFKNFPTTQHVNNYSH